MVEEQLDVGRSPTETTTPWQYPLSIGAAVSVVPADTPGIWTCRPDPGFSGATPAWGLSQADIEAARSTGEAADADGGVAEAFVSTLRHQAVPPVPGFRLLRLVPPPEASGERPEPHLDPGAGPVSECRVVVGERVAVTWLHQIVDADNIAPLLHAHLDAVDFVGVQETYGALLWTAPSGREVPVAWARRYLPRARDGWDWCVELTRQALGVGPERAPKDPWAADFPARLGGLTARLHGALATPSKVLPEPTGAAGPDQIRAWHAVASRALDRALCLAQGSDAVPGLSEVLLPRAGALRAAIDALERLADDGGTALVQRIHGDLHVGQVLRWSAGLTVVDFHPDPELGFEDLRLGQCLQPAARDVARLLRSLDHVARVIDKESGFALTPAVDAWSARARSDLLAAYAREHPRPDGNEPGESCPVEPMLIKAFEAEQLCREIVYACEQLPDWVYAPLGGLWQEYPAGEVSPRRARHAAPS